MTISDLFTGWFIDAICRTLQNLSLFAKIIQWVRLITSLLIIIRGMVLVLGPSLNPANLYISKFVGYTYNITAGLMLYLQGEVESFGSSIINNGVCLSTSELQILGSYAYSKLEGIPQYITISLYGECQV